MKRLARRKRPEAPAGGNAPWLATFADLMNLLLCFFVLLFAMSDVDGEKFEEISVSFSNAFGVLDGGRTAIGEGQLISSGLTQLNDLDEFFSTMGAQSEETGEEIKKDSTNKVDFELEDAREKILEEMANQSEEMYDQILDLSELYELGSFVELSIDSEYKYVQLSLKGSILYESGKADIIEQAKPFLSKMGELLSKFEGFTIEIIGHTDNVPMSSGGAFRDNNWLSSARALNAAEFLINNNNLDPAKLKYSGRGEYEPVSSNSTAEGRAKNRRIEIRIYNELSN